MRIMLSFIPLIIYGIGRIIVAKLDRDIDESIADLMHHNRRETL
jgi:hypothetical protein